MGQVVLNTITLEKMRAWQLIAHREEEELVELRARAQKMNYTIFEQGQNISAMHALIRSLRENACIDRRNARHIGDEPTGETSPAAKTPAQRDQERDGSSSLSKTDRAQVDPSREGLATFSENGQCAKEAKALHALARTYVRLQDEVLERERIFKDDIMDPVVRSLARRTSRDPPAVDVAPEDKGNGVGTSAKCYEVGGTFSSPRLGKKFGDLSVQTVCVFERLCWEGGHFVAYTTDTNAWPPGSYHWPPKLTGGAGLFLVKEASADWKTKLDSLDPSPIWLVVHSYQKHTTHFLEHVAPMFAATSLLPPERLFSSPDRKVARIRLLDHGPDLFDWQKGALQVAAYNQQVTLEFGHPADGTCYAKAVVPGFLFTLFEDRLAARSWRSASYALLSIPEPKQPVRRIAFLPRNSKRVVKNHQALVDRVSHLAPDDVKVDVTAQGSMSFQQQIQNMADAGMVVGMHGADLTNCIFLTSGSVLIEINPPHWYILPVPACLLVFIQAYLYVCLVLGHAK